MLYHDSINLKMNWRLFKEEHYIIIIVIIIITIISAVHLIT